MVSLIDGCERQNSTCYFCGTKPVKYKIQEAQHIHSCNNPSCFAKIKDYDNLLTANRKLQRQVNKYRNMESWQLNPEPPH